MTSPTRTHPAAETWAREHVSGALGRREFLARATAMGVAAGSAYAMIGLAAPAHAEAHAAAGGTLRMSMPVREMREPRMADTTEQGGG